MNQCVRTAPRCLRRTGSHTFAKNTLVDKAPIIDNNPGMARRRSRKLSDQMRRAIDESGQTRYRIAVETGIDQSALAKFYNGHRGLSMDAVDRLGEYLGLQIVTKRKPDKRAGR